MTSLTLVQQTVGELVRKHPHLSREFEAWGIDYCCGGKKTLLVACQNKHLDVADITQRITASLAEDHGRMEEDVNQLELAALCDHIYDRHHQYLYREMPRLQRMMDKVAEVHGEKEPGLYRLKELYTQLKNELEIHMQKEERVLFPYCKTLAETTTIPEFHCGSIQNPIRVMEREHDDAGQILSSMRELTKGYTPPDWACNTYRALLDGLREIEQDLHLHIHKENNILFPNALKRANDLELCSLANR